MTRRTSIKESIEDVVKALLPKGKPAKLVWLKVRFEAPDILRVITPAWKSLPVEERVYRLQKLLDERLTPEQKEQIFRISVLTPGEVKRLEFLHAA